MLKRIAVTAFALLMCIILAAPAFAAAPMQSYYYNAGGLAVSAPMPYSFVKEITGEDLMMKNPETGEMESIGNFKNPGELVVGKDNSIYVVDSGNARIVVINEDLVVTKILSEFYYKGETLTLNTGAQGLYVYEYDGKKELYISDTDNNRIIHCDMDGNVKNIYTKPDWIGVNDDQAFYPARLVVDRAGRMYLLGRTVNRGVIKMGADGSFDSFYGAPPVVYSFAEKIWRALSTDAMRQASIQYVPTEYSSISMDSRGFIYVTQSDLNRKEFYGTFYTTPDASSARSQVAAVRKLSLAGADILIRGGIFPPVGEITILDINAYSPIAAGFSLFTDISITDYDVYTVLDRNRGRLFTYDAEGNLLFIFGNVASQDGAFMFPVAVSYYKGDQLIVLDQQYGSIQVFSPTDYGATVLGAVKAYHDGEYELSEELWEKVLDLNSNMTVAYTGAGKSKFRAGDYTGAMADFKVSQNTIYYSKALSEYMKQLIGNSFSYIFLGALALALVMWILRMSKRFRAFLKDGVKKVM